MMHAKHFGFVAIKYRAWKSRRTMKRNSNRRGSALILTLLLTLSLASLASSAIYLGGNDQLIANTYDQERDMRYAAEAVLAMGKSTLNYDPYAAPSTGDTTVMSNAQVMGADGNPIPGITASMYIGPTSSNTGQFGRFVSVVAVVKNQAGATVVRRLELAQESFAKFSYWSNIETRPDGTPIYFNNADQIWGPVWSNDQINVGSGGATFHNPVGTAKTIAGLGYGTFEGGYSQNQKPITLPNNTQLAALSGYASAANFNFTSPTAGDISTAQMRIEFVARPLNGGAGGGSTGLPLNGADDGFFRVYVSNAGAAWLRGDATSRANNCGATYVFTKIGTGFGSPTRPAFVPLSENTKTWFAKALTKSGYYTTTQINNLTTGSASTLEGKVLGQTTARCYLGGDPNLRTVSYRGSAAYRADTAAAVRGAATDADVLAAAQNIAGDSTTFFAGTPSNPMGYWLTYPGAVDGNVAALFPAEAPYLYPLYRGLNRGTKGVIYVNGTTGISGTLRARVTVYATGSVAILRDMKYVTDPSLNNCTADMLGIIAGNDIMIADNALQDPLNVASGVGYKNMDDTKDVFVQGVMMALNESFGAENYTSGATNANDCGTVNVGRGCLNVAGGIIQKRRGPVGLSSGQGFTKQYSYDKCALYNPPPYFPTTGRYTDNRYYEVDPNGFDVTAMYQALTPNP
ncbi:MAG: hypothetical protein ABI194_04605 [Gemmatimonadaceae bacterium]